MDLPELTAKELFAARELKQAVLQRVRGSKQVDIAVAERDEQGIHLLMAEYILTMGAEENSRVEFLAAIEHWARNAVTAELLTGDLDPAEVARALDNLPTA